MRIKYNNFRDKVKNSLQGEKYGLKWNQTRKNGQIEYTRPCYTWIKELEEEIGLIPERKGKYVYWKLQDTNE